MKFGANLLSYLPAYILTDDPNDPEIFIYSFIHGRKSKKKQASGAKENRLFSISTHLCLNLYVSLSQPALLQSGLGPLGHLLPILPATFLSLSVPAPCICLHPRLRHYCVVHNECVAQIQRARGGDGASVGLA
jgi:hypothetical protein